MQRNAQPVYFQFRNKINIPAVRQSLTAIDKSLQLIQIVRVVQRHQRHRMDERPQTVRLPADTLRRAVRGYKLRMFAFEFFQPLKELVEFKI